VNPSAGGAISQSPVVQKTPAQSAQPTIGLTEKAFAATTMGATAGLISEHSAARKTLRTVVEAVARQQPNVNWAAGKRPDGSIVLVTDIASGWIPPGIEIPAGVQLLDPAPRRGSLETLLGDVIEAESWAAGQHLPSSKDAPPVNMSLRARDLPPVDDLSWELTQVTNWRDGLPRLAHTLAKAGVSGTGVLPNEIELISEHLRLVSAAALQNYPASIDGSAVGNWQLLAAIHALITDQKTALNYHFAWFKALNMASQGGTR